MRSWLDRGKGSGSPDKRTDDTEAGAETLWDEDTDWGSVTSPNTPRSTDLTPTQQEALTGGWVNLNSSNVEQIRYLVEDSILEVIFHSGAAYQYYDVPAQKFVDFVHTDSPGRFVWNQLRYWYEYAKVADATPGKKVPSHPRNPFVIRRLPDINSSNPIEREHAIRMGVEEDWRRGTRRIRSWL